MTIFKTRRTSEREEQKRWQEEAAAGVRDFPLVDHTVNFYSAHTGWTALVPGNSMHPVAVKLPPNRGQIHKLQ